VLFLAFRDLVNFSLTSCFDCCWCMFSGLAFGQFSPALDGYLHLFACFPLCCFFASWSAMLLPATPSSPSTHLMTIFIPGCWSMTPLICLCSAFIKYCPDIALSLHVVWIAAYYLLLCIPCYVSCLSRGTEL
jgi:hypothetical protein